MRISGFGFFQDRHAINVFHLQVGDDNIKVIAVQQVKGFEAVGCKSDIISIFGQCVLQIFSGNFIIINDQDLRAAR